VNRLDRWMIWAAALALLGGWVYFIVWGVARAVWGTTVALRGCRPVSLAPRRALREATERRLGD